jgi:pilus assembly protein FimV
VTDLPLESGQSAGHEVKTTILAPETMSQLRAEGAAQAAAQGAPTETEIPAPPSTTTFSPSTDISLDVPPVTSTTSNVIDFEFDPTKTANLEAPSAPSTATFDPDRTMVISPENQEKAQNLDIEIDLSSLETKGPAETTKDDAPAAPAPSDISFDFKVPAVEAPPTVAGVVPPTDIKLDVPEFKPADTATMDFALDTVSFDLGSMQSRETPAAPVHDEHWYDVQTKFDLAKAYQEMGDKEGAREILAEVIKEGDAQQQAEAKTLLEKLE